MKVKWDLADPVPRTEVMVRLLDLHFKTYSCILLSMTKEIKPEFVPRAIVDVIMVIAGVYYILTGKNNDPVAAGLGLLLIVTGVRDVLDHL